VQRRPATAAKRGEASVTWSAEDDRALLVSKHKGKTYEEIAAELRAFTPEQVQARYERAPDFQKKKTHFDNQKRMKAAAANGSNWGVTSRTSPSGTMPFMKAHRIPKSMRNMYAEPRPASGGRAAPLALSGVPEQAQAPASQPSRPVMSVKSGYAESTTRSHRSTLLSVS